MKTTLKRAFLATLPVLTGYLVLGFGFGIVLKSAGHGVFVALLMSLTVYAGSMQYAAVGLLASGASLVTVALTTLAVNARHLFYGVSMLERYKGVGARKPYLIFSLTDETYSLVCTDPEGIPEERRKDYYLFVSILNHAYWVIGTLLGAVVGALVPFSSEGIDFALTALFLTVFLDQWLNAKRYFPALLGVGVSLLCLLVFGPDRFLIPTMLVIALVLSLSKGGARNG